jgi:hypothetical protein
MNVQSHPRALASIVPTCNRDVHGTVMDGEMVLLNLNTGRYYTLNTVGTMVWELCMAGKTLEDIHQALCVQFEVSSERAEQDLFELVNQLEQEGLLSTERR